MTKETLANMNAFFWPILSVLMFLAWVSCMVFWVARGCPIPKWVHVLAVCLSAAGLAVVITAGVMGFLTWQLATGCTLIPPVATYFLWLWMHGPAWGEE